MEPTLGAFTERADGAIVIVTAAPSAGRRGGCLVGFFSQVSIEPALLVVWLSRANATFDLAVECHHLAVHLVPADREPVAQWFAETSGDDTDKLDAVAWVPGPHRTMLLEGCGNWVVGRVVQLIEVADSDSDEGEGEGEGDHVGFVIAPVEVHTSTGEKPALRLHDVINLTAGHPAKEGGVEG